MSNDKASTNRETLVKITGLVRPALANQAYIPALTHIRFDGKYATSYNDISAISVRCSLELERCVPGELLIRSLGSFSGETVMVQEGKDGAITISSGRSKVKLPALALDKFPLELPDDDAPEIDLDAGILKGIARCLISVGNDPTHPAQMGVTLDVDEKGRALLFSTDNYTISRFQTKSEVKLPGDAPVILPAFFCEQLARLATTFPEAEVTLYLHAGALLARFGKDAMLFTKTLVDLEPLDFPKHMAKAVELPKLKAQLSDIPPGFDAAVERALLVLSGEVDKVTAINPGDGVFAMVSESPLGNADDHLKFDAQTDCDQFHVDPSHLARAAKVCGKMAFLPRTLVMSDDEMQFVHLVSHVVHSKK